MILHRLKNANYSLGGLFRITVEYVFDCVEFSVMIWVVNNSYNTNVLLLIQITDVYVPERPNKSKTLNGQI